MKGKWAICEKIIFKLELRFERTILDIQEKKRKGALLWNKGQVCSRHLLKRDIDKKFWASVSHNITYKTLNRIKQRCMFKCIFLGPKPSQLNRHLQWEVGPCIHFSLTNLHVFPVELGLILRHLHSYSHTFCKALCLY